METLDLTQKPKLGVSLIEASAGTGKTYSISNLYLHFILAGKSIREILVVTFTEAATKELRDRIRVNLSLAMKVAKGQASEESIEAILKQYPTNTALLEAAVINFDQAAIFTIHGFCQRMLLENAFESSCLFDAELLQDDSILIDEVVNDFWRTHIYPLSAKEIDMVNFKRDDLKDFCKKVIQEPMLEIKGVVDDEQLEQTKRGYEQAIVKFQEALNLFGDCRDELKALLYSGDLNGRSYSEKSWPTKAADLESFLKNPGTDNKALAYFGSNIHAKIKKGKVAPEHSFFKLCETLESVDVPDLKNEFNLYLKTKLKETIPAKVAAIKKRLNGLTYEDLIQQLHYVLEREEGDGLLHQRIREKYSVALVDEFQDTDPKQYEIFNSLFGHSQEHSFYMIGDPKQSIYAFRGADIFAYLVAKNKAEHKYTLSTNYRSEAGMVSAVNTFFLKKGSEEAFACAPEEGKEGITFDEVKSGAEKRVLHSKNPDHLRLRWYENPEAEKAEAKSKVGGYFSSSVCRDIVNLLNDSQAGDAYFTQGNNTERVKPGDIAILVSKHSEAQDLKDLLLTHRVPSVIQKSGNVFDSAQAKDLLRFLHAVQEPKDQYIMPLLLSDFFDLTAHDLQARDDQQALDFLTELIDYQKRWSRRGILRTLQKFIDKRNFKTKTLKQNGGERSLSNMMQLRDILHQVEMENGLGLAGLARFLNEKINSSNKDDELYLQRLETDANAVQIMTIHKSKGLEFPIVFCPYMWSKPYKHYPKAKGAFDKNGAFPFHCEDEQGSHRAYSIDASDDNRESYRAQWQREQLGEQLRLLYVAMTRAANRCYLYWGAIKNEPSMYTYLANKTLKGSGIIASQGKIDELSLPQRKGFWQEDLGKEAHINFTEFFDEDIPELTFKDDSQAELCVPPEPPEISSSWMVGSYSGLSRSHSKITYVPEKIVSQADDDQGLTEAEKEKLQQDVEAQGFFAFPRGATPGLAIHEVFENIDFQNDQFWDRTIEAKLKSYRLHGGSGERGEKILAERLDSTKEMIRAVLETELLPSDLVIAGKPVNNFCLKELSRQQRLDEMEFYYPIKNIRKNDLAAIFHRHYPQGHINASFAHDIQSLNYPMEQGFLNGSIDLSFEKDNKFYVLDWKSNHMGNQHEYYHKEALRETVRESFYFLQYHIYTLALHLFLEQKMGAAYSYEENFGGVIYAFVRGFKKGTHFGIHWDRIPVGMLEDMKALLINGKTVQQIQAVSL